ncbi:coagulation factor 5/8 type domain-containing protein [Streptomyces sp. 150FB]|uniref:discoidin domain-containing protein n=1 Tax=Streptomyces sp. 150FB TaxID=1576605 RepID=UPI000588ECD6|nr:glycosyl hydrolase family 28-related protein [Streptomyces sp. 150FB]KIF73201.1 coagulation factor 5/8 type domain-containing protein [Streptomyces sp. 150FB]
MPLPRQRSVAERLRLLLLALLTMALLAPGVATAAPRAAGPDMYPHGIGADLGPTPRTLGVTPTAGDDPAGLVTGELDGRTYWATDTAAGTGHLDFTLDPDYLARLTSATATFSVTYRDTGTGFLTLRPAGGAPPLQAGFTGTGTWRTSTFDLSTAAAGAGPLRLDGVDGADARDITVTAVRVGTPGASVTLGATPSPDGITPRAGDGSTGLVTGEAAGRGYWGTDRTAPAPGIGFLYMNVADTFLYNTTDTVLVSVDYFDEGGGSFGLHYDSPGDQISDMFKPSDVFTYGDTRTWRTHTFALDDALMTNRSNGADFRIHTADSAVELKVAAVRITVVPAELKPTEGLERLIADASRVHTAAREGARDGQYPPGAKDTLASAIAAARRTADTEGTTEAQLKAALNTLDQALNSFRSRAVDTNLARGAKVTASSTAPGGSPGRATDGDAGSGWTSGDGGAGEWLIADLGKALAVNEVQVAWGSAASRDYTVQVSLDGTHFTTVGHNGGSGNRTVRTPFDRRDARYVRLTSTGYSAGADTVTVGELEVRDQRVVRPEPRLVKTVHPVESPVVADFDVTEHGADPTGVKDSTKAIQQALYDCYDAGGGTVWMPRGTYRVTDTLEVHSFCTLRGDRRDPDRGKGSYGTVVSADLPPGAEGPVLFRIGGSAGVMGVTTYYPRQSASDPVPYNSTFEVPGDAWSGNENYMMATVADVTMLNSYRGVGVSTMPNDQGLAPSAGQVHESTTLRDIKGTVLSEGFRAYNGADVGTWENITLDNGYWAKAPAAYHPPKRAALDAWTRANGTGFVLGDLEWDQFYNIRAADYRTGIHITQGQRAAFTGSFLQADIRRTGVAVEATSFDTRWGLSFAASTLEGSEAAVRNTSTAYVKLTDTTTAGPVSGIVHRMAGAVPRYQQSALPKPARAALYDVTRAPYSAPAGHGTMPERDATARIQRALDTAGRDGGGTVYLPAGWYRVSSHLRVPAGVELRGSSAVPNRDLNGASNGTVLMAYEGRNTPHPDTATALVTLDGAHAGVRGLRIFHPENNPAADPDNSPVPYPYAVRGNGTGTYALDLALPNAWNGIDMAAHRNDGFTVRKLAGAVFHRAISVGRSDGGRIEGVLNNGNAVGRVGYALPNWALESDIFPQVIDSPMREQARIVTVAGAKRLTVFDAFAYGFHDGLVVSSGDVRAFNIGTDNLGAGGFTVKVDASDASTAAAATSVTAVNVLRYNGATSSGPAKLYNIMAINMLQQTVTTTAEPPGSGTVRLTGNESEPGRYEKGSEVTASAHPAPGKRFVNWTVNGEEVSREAEVTLTVTADLAVSAHFAPLSGA